MDKIYKCEEHNLVFKNFQTKANHDRWHHKKISFSDSARQNMIECVKKSNKRRAELKHGRLIKETRICKCGIEFETEFYEFAVHQGRKTCSEKCSHSNTVWTEERKEKLSKSVSIAIKKKWEDPEYAEKCSNRKSWSSKGERELVKYFKDNFPDEGWTSGGLVIDNEIRTARDLYSDKLKVCIEYDGIWHFKDIKGQLKSKQQKDKALKGWCIKNGYRLIRIREEIYAMNKKLWQETLHMLATLEHYDQITKIY